MHKVTTKQVLVYVDDDRDDLQLIQNAMSPYEDIVEVCVFERSADAYNFLVGMEKREEKPCLIILDVNMPAMSGRELLPKLRSISFFDEVPIILFTTSSSQHDYSFALRYNAGFITKPTTLQQMNIIAEQFLSHCSEEVRESINRKV